MSYASPNSDYEANSVHFDPRRVTNLLVTLVREEVQEELAKKVHERGTDDSDGLFLSIKFPAQSVDINAEPIEVTLNLSGDAVASRVIEPSVLSHLEFVESYSALLAGLVDLVQGLGYALSVHDSSLSVGGSRGSTQPTGGEASGRGSA